MRVLTMKDLAERWDKSYINIRVMRTRGKLPPPDLDLPHSPAWFVETIEAMEGPHVGRTDNSG